MTLATDRDQQTEATTETTHRVLAADHDQRVLRARRSLAGLSVGDSLGECFFGRDEHVREQIARRRVPSAPWTYTDDTEMAMAVVEVLEAHGRVDQDALAASFARRYRADPRRGYGGGAHDLLQALNRGASWRQAAGEMFEGQGSYGNGGAMRAAPLGAYFAGETAELVEQARLSAEVTHAHADGQAGAIAVALAASFAHEHRDEPGVTLGDALLAYVVEHTPGSATRDGIAQARRLFTQGASFTLAAEALGTGYRVSSQDTVPFCLFALVHHLDDYESAFWATVAGLGDRDTTCAIVGGIVALRAEPPAGWVQAREALPG